MKSSLLCKEVFTHNKVQHLARCSQAPDDQRKKLAIRVDCSVGPVVQLQAARSKVDAEVPGGTSCRVMYWYSGLYCPYYAFFVFKRCAGQLSFNLLAALKVWLP